MGAAVAVRGGLEGAQAPEESVNEPGTGGPPPPWPAGAAWLDGRHCPIEDARISGLDLGVTPSGCTHDVAHVWPGPFYPLHPPPAPVAARHAPPAPPPRPVPT